ncbi:MAG TPA: ATP-dependent sacrificial sulfur transferase LarE [Planctomycetota bacterium]|nr:ATP-dependent sacrificial sulfur transferase LarE [Planctomycetota bacterium]
MRALPPEPPRPPAAMGPREAALRLDAWFAPCPSAAVAFSGGVDSALVAFWARRCLGRERATAWIADSPSLKRSDLEDARAFSVAHDIPLRVLATREVEDPAYAANPVDRCFHCKRTLYRTLADELGRDAVWILSGANLDDQGDYRPGMAAAAEASVRHPLLACGVGKDAIRALAREVGLVVWDKPASPCLSSRIPYGQAVTASKLARIEAAEAWLLGRGFPVGRVRHDGETARVEVPLDRIAELSVLGDELRDALLGLGFNEVAVDAEGFVSGKLNRAIGGGR